MMKLDVMLREYETLRQESLDSIRNRTQIVAFGLATIGIVAGAVMSSDTGMESVALVTFVFALGIPSISVLVLYIWLGEVERMMRCGDYLQDLEMRINVLVDPDDSTLRWEQWLRSSHKQLKYPYLVVIAMFLGLLFASPLVGFFALGARVSEYCVATAVPWVAGLAIALCTRRRWLDM